MSAYDDDDEVTYEVGEVVWAYDEEDGYWYPAVIVELGDDSVTVVFDEDDDEGVELDYETIRPLELEAGDEVECWDDADEMYYAAVVETVDPDEGIITVQFDNGDTADVDPGYLRLDGNWHEGDYVWADGGDGYWYPAEITAIDDEGIQALFLSDETEAVLDEDGVEDLYVDVDDVVEVWWDEDEAYYEATVVGLTDDGQLDVAFDDGSEATVDLADIRIAG